MGCIGCLMATVGLDPTSGTSRFVFGSINLIAGLGLLSILLGIFAIPNIINRILDKSYLKKYKSNIKVDFKVDFSDKLSISEIKQCMPTILKSSGIGVFIGAIPGPGAAIAAFISYNEAKRSSKHPKDFGHGALEGIAAPESANNAVTAASLIPLLTLGLPGSVVAATLIGALTMHGLITGPSLFREQGVTIYAILIGTIFLNLFMFAQGKLLIKYFAKVMNIPQILLIPILVLFCTTGAFAFNESLFDIIVLLVSGSVVYILNKLEFPAIPVILGMILGPLAEINLKRSLVMSEGSWLIFITRPISLFFVVITILFLLITVKGQKNS